MNIAQLLKGKHAVLFGAGGSFGSVVAREFAAEGGDVFLSGRSRSNVEEVAEQITADGEMAHVAVIDAEDAVAVDTYIDAIATETGSGLLSAAALASHAVLERLMKRGRQIWAIIAIVALALSLGTPLSGSGIPAANRAVLLLIHLAVGGVLIPTLYWSSHRHTA